MKKYLLFVLSFAFLFSCNNVQKKAEEKISVVTKDVSNLSFDELFKSVEPFELSDNIFKLFGRDFVVITSGDKENYNSMTAGYGGWGILFDEPSTWTFLRANRYTLEYIRENKTYTMSNFGEEYKDQVIYFGSSSGRDSEKMKNHQLTAVETPSGNMTYKEASLVVECELTEITTVQPDDLYTEKGRDFILDGYNEAKDYHKLVFGKITNVWVRK